MLRYPCLILDHDDTVVQTERAIGYPYFRDYLEKVRPGVKLSFRDYVHACHNTVFPDMCRATWQFTDEEMKEEYSLWQDYCASHIPPIFPGVDDLIRRQKAEGGLVCVVSLSSHANIVRDYDAHFGFQPDAIYDNDLPKDRRKPLPWPLLDIMERFGLKPEDLLVVDDMMLGVEMARTAGIHTAYAAWSKQEFPELMAEMKAACNFAFDYPENLKHFLFEEM